MIISSVEPQNNNFTYDIDQGGFSEDNELSIDQRGFKTFIQKEAEEFLKSEQLLLNATVKKISYSGDGVTVTLVDGSELSADYALTTFSLGVLQHDDVNFEPELPLWKQEAIHSMDMVRILKFYPPDDATRFSLYPRAQGIYTKIFLQFPHKFWFDTEVWSQYPDRFAGS